MGDEVVGRFARLWPFLVAVLVLVLGSQNAWAAEEGAKVFDPRLSLTGDCTAGSISSLDEILDPGCPDSHPTKAFAAPTAVTTDFYGDIYVASYGKSFTGLEGRIDVFNPTGVFLTEVLVPRGPVAMAVDSKGFLYVGLGGLSSAGNDERVVRYDPTLYEPEDEEIEYSSAPFVLEESESAAPLIAVAINVENDHVFRNTGGKIVEYASAEDNNEVVEVISPAREPYSLGLAIDAEHRRIYETVGPNSKVVEILNVDPPHEELGQIVETSVPGETFVGPLSVAVDEGTGHVFVFDTGASKVYEFEEDGTYVATIEHGFQATPVGSQITIDNGPFSPNGGESEEGRYLFVPSHPKGIGHSFAFGPAGVAAVPKVESTGFRNVSETEAETSATINPGNLPTTYTFELITRQQFEEQGESFSGATVIGKGQLPAGKVGVPVAAAAQGLLPGTEYSFRVVANNDEGSSSSEGSFRTYPALASGPCPNDQLRTGLSAALPDCRAYELVTPPDTNGRPPIGARQLGLFFTTAQTSPDGGKVPFFVQGGSIPGVGGTGGASPFAGDPFLATRTPAGWSSTYIGPTGLESLAPLPGSTSSDQGYSFFQASPDGTAAIEGKPTSYVRYPDGHKAPVGRGSLGVDPGAAALFISPNGGHIVFANAADGLVHQLEPDVPPPFVKEVEEGGVKKTKTINTVAVFDRTSDEATHVVSLLPGDVTPKAEESATYMGISADGKGIAFTIGATLYLRFDNSETYEVGKSVTFAGVAEGGSRVFYLEGGQLWRLDVLSGVRTAFNSSGAVTPVNVSADGSAAYFVSTSVLTKAANPVGAKAEKNKQNLYRSHEGSISYVGTVTERDVVSEEIVGVESIDGLGLWTTAVRGRLGEDPSRTTANGNVLLFQSRAPLADYDSGGHAEVYRYDAARDELDCLSCNPTGVAAGGDATLQPYLGEGGLQVLTTFAVLSNLSSDGQRAFFQSPDPLVARDTDERQDVYEWEAQGVGSCTRPEGCVDLISSGQSARDNYLFAVSPSGDDAFVLSSDLLLPADTDETPSIYDARVNGGFFEPTGAECQGEGCRPGISPPPLLPDGRTPALGKGDNVKHVNLCPKGKRRTKRHGKVRCAKRHHAKHGHRRAGSKQKGGAK